MSIPRNSDPDLPAACACLPSALPAAFWYKAGSLTGEPDVNPQDAAIADVIASGVHDTKNTLFDALMRIGVAQSAIRRQEGDAALPLLDEAATAVEEAAERLGTILSAYRLARHENPVTLQPVPVAQLLDDVVARMALVPEESPLRLDVAAGFAGVWMLDRELVADSLINALRNAFRFARTTIRLTSSVVEETLVLAVEDDGPGFGGDEADSAANSASTSASTTGHSGIGLRVAERIAFLHQRQGRHGQVCLDNASTLGVGGARFRMVLP